MSLLKQYLECMEKGDHAGLADLFCDGGVLHDSSLIKIGQDTLHLEGRMAVEMMFHHKFGINGGPFPITGVRYKNEDTAWYFIQYDRTILAVTAFLSEVRDGRIARLNIYPL